MSKMRIVSVFSGGGKVFVTFCCSGLYVVYILGYLIMLLNMIMKNQKVWFSIIFCKGLASEIHKAQTNILVFGGNGFIGSECVKSLLKEGHKLTLINRGNEYWDSAVRVKPFVNEVHCNRVTGIQNCKTLMENDEIRYFDFVLDFSAYHASMIDNAFASMKNKIGTYIYISSDSVYEVSEQSSNKWSKEEDAVRPKSKELISELNEKDEYGNFKFSGEEYLQSRYNTSRIPFVILRLPDVIGPRDTTCRWWPYQAWFQYYSSFEKPLHLPRYLRDVETSYVYVKDVAEVVTKIISQISSGDNSTHKQAFNLAFPDKYTLKKLLDSMQKALNVKGVEYRYSDDSIKLLPSVLRGPIDITKAKDKLNWQPTPWTQAIQETVDFYKDAMYKFPRERDSMIKKLQEMVGADFPNLALKIEDDLIKYVKDRSPDHTEL